MIKFTVSDMQYIIDNNGCRCRSNWKSLFDCRMFCPHYKHCKPSCTHSTHNINRLKYFEKEIKREKIKEILK